MNRASPKLAPDLAKRAERLTATIAVLKVKIQQVFDEGEVAPKGCYVARYQVRQKQKIYWYYKLQVTVQGVRLRRTTPRGVVKNLGRKAGVKNRNQNLVV